MINKHKISYYNTLNYSEDNQLSGLLPLSSNRKIIDLSSKNSNELNIFDSSINNNDHPYFFRKLTRTNKEDSFVTNKNFVEKILKYFEPNNDVILSNFENFSPAKYDENDNLYCIIHFTQHEK